MNTKANQREVMMVSLIKTGHLINQRIDKVLKRYDITTLQYNILRILKGASPECLSVGEVKSRLTLATSDLTRVMDRLVKKEFVERNTCSENRRQVNVNISTLGLKTLETILPEIKTCTNNFFEKEIELNEVDQLLEIFKKLNLR